MKTWTGLFLLLCPFSLSHAKLQVVTSTTDLKALAAEVGGTSVGVDSIARGTQDPHFIETKPSFMVKVLRADLVISNGLDLEVGWLPSILRGGRNPKVMPGQKGYLELGKQIDPIEIPAEKVTRAQGDVHPNGNPHFTLDPLRMADAAILVGERLAELDPAQAASYRSRAGAVRDRLRRKVEQWAERVRMSRVQKVVTYHRTLNYFLSRFGIEPVIMLEPKPGIPPTGTHILQVIREVREKKVPLILVENYFDPSVTRRISQEVPSVQVRPVPVSVEGESSIRTLDDLYEHLVKTIEGATLK